MQLIYTLATCLLFGSALAGLYPPNSNVISITKKNFLAEVIESDHLYLVEFYAPWCGHCKNLAPEWEKAATNLKGIVKVGAINCDEEKELCSTFQIQGFPTIKTFPAERSANPHQKGSPWKNPEDYQGARSASGIVNYATNKMPSSVVSVKKSSIEKFLSGNENINKVLLFTDKSKTSNLYKALSSEFKGRLDLGEVRNTEKDLVKEYGIQKFPSLIVIKKGEESPISFTGKLDVKALTEFLSKFCSPKKTFEPPKNQERQKQPEVQEEDIPAVVYALKNQADWKKHCLDNTRANPLCVVAVLSQENSGEELHTKYQEILGKVSEKNKKNFLFMWIDGVEQLTFTNRLGLNSGFPSLFVFSPKKKLVTPYIGAFDIEKINDFLGKAIRGGRGTFSVDEIPSLVDPTLDSEKLKDEKMKTKLEDHPENSDKSSTSKDEL